MRLAVHRPLKAEYFLVRIILTRLNVHIYVVQVVFFSFYSNIQNIVGLRSTETPEVVLV